ncbi:DpdA-like tRNA-guanine transglycosylase [Arthrobacter phage Sonali]|uniref:Queuine tRNA-ribosyltransferase n=1 Tax=Arthrobacter phage Sonali TaxID=2510495 RepID=A0A411CR13_9CAUD|nr:queuine tRNA-ribosyltransferase [Arthrobacter phage Sonali]QAY16193.1 DpdA-like tRNA-guanine transglycosylase [Arthrobacter phage Sonali]
MLYLANPCSAPAIVAAMEEGTLGFITTPSQGNKRPPGSVWCADNGCFGKGYPGDEKWLAWLDRRKDQAGSCLFATAPDVVGDAVATLARSAPFLPLIRAMGYPAALVAQDGLEDLVVPWDDFDVLFIGGSTEWKLGPAARELVRQAKARGKHVHMGRVNSGKRYRYAESIGCDSVDGTFLRFAPTENLQRLRAWSRPDQDALFPV